MRRFHYRRQGPRPRSLAQLLTLCGLLAVTMLVMQHAKQPRAWHWLTGEPSEKSASTSPSSMPVRPILIEDEPPPGAFWSQNDDAEQPPSATGGPQPPTASESSVPQRDTGAGAAPAPPESPRVNQALLAGIKDRTAVRPPGAYFHLLDLARRIPPQVLEGRLARKDPSLAELAGSPALFRGVPVRINGYARRVTPMHLGANTLGLKTVYQVDVFSSEFDQNPWVFVVSRLPERFPVQDHMVESVSVTGYFLKLWAYQAGDGARFAPLLIGHRLVWRPRGPDVQFAQFGYVMIGLLMGLIGAFLVVVWWSQRSERRYRRLQPAAVSPQEIETLRQLDNGGPEAALRRLEQEARDESRSPSPRDVQADAVQRVPQGQRPDPAD